MTDPPRDRIDDCNAWAEWWLSAPRFGRYLAEAHQDPGLALEIYEWNLRLGAAHREILHFSELLLPQLAEYIRDTSIVTRMLEERPKR